MSRTPWPPLVRRVFRRTPTSTADSRAAVDEELAFHLEMVTQEYEAQGISPDEAYERALAEFGDLELTREYCAEQAALRHTEARSVMRVEEVIQDLGFAWRTLRKNWSYTLVVVGTLAFGIAANTLIFSVMNPYFFRPLPYGDSDRIVQLGQIRGGYDGNRFSLGQIDDWTARSQAFEDVAAYWYNTKNLTGAEGAVRVMTTFVTDNMFDVLQSEALVGRTIQRGEGGPGGSDVVVISQGLWESRYGSDPSLIGRTIALDGVPHTVIGVMDSEFSFPFNEVRLWLPVREDAASEGRSNNNYMPVARLKADWTPERARAELSAIQRDFASLYPEEEGRFTGVSVKPIRAALNFAWDPLRISFSVLLTAVVFVLMIACVNVASLTLARASTRAREVAVRAAVGAARGRLVRQLLTESIVLAILGGATGIGLAFWGAALIGPFIPEGLYRVGEVSIDGTVLLFSLVITLITPMAFGLAPAISATRSDLAATLKEGGGGSGMKGALRGRRVLVVVEVALAIALIAGTGLMVRSFAEIQSVDLGFDSERLLVAELTPSPYSYETSEEVDDFFNRASEQIMALPGVVDVAQTTWLPLNHETLSISIAVPGSEPVDADDWPSAIRGRVSNGYFEAMGIRVVSGREFLSSDGPDDPPVAVISTLLAERLWPGESPVGRSLSMRTAGGATPVTVVGVVDDIQHSDLNGAKRPYFYRPLSQATSRRRFLVVAANGQPSRLMAPVRQSLQEVDANLPFDLRVMDQVVQENTLQWALGSTFLGVFGLGGLLLASLGIYGVISYSVAQRRREMGIRIAMGASKGDIRSAVVSEGLKLTGLGLVIGFVLALGVGKVLSSFLLYGVSGFDPATFGSVLILFVAVAALASLVPAIRAGRVDPLKVLRTE
jgi:predicted permease